MRHLLFCAAVCINFCGFLDASERRPSPDDIFTYRGTNMTFRELDAKVDEVISRYDFYHAEELDVPGPREEKEIECPEFLKKPVKCSDGTIFYLDKRLLLDLEGLFGPQRHFALFFDLGRILPQPLFIPFRGKVREIEVALMNGIMKTGDDEIIGLIPTDYHRFASIMHDYMPKGCFSFPAFYGCFFDRIALAYSPSASINAFKLSLKDLSTGQRFDRSFSVDDMLELIDKGSDEILKKIDIIGADDKPWQLFKWSFLAQQGKEDIKHYSSFWELNVCHVGLTKCISKYIDGWTPLTVAFWKYPQLQKLVRDLNESILDACIIESQEKLLQNEQVSIYWKQQATEAIKKRSSSSSSEEKE